MGEFDGKVAIVTGAARGLGRDYAEFLVEDGAAVVLADVNGEGAETSAKELEEKGGRAIGLQVDVTDDASVDAMVAFTVHELGGVDMLINNAAIWGDLEYSLAPGMIYNEASQRQVPKDVFEGLLQQTVPAKRAGTSRDMYSAIRWLCHDEADYVTGQVISPNGGSRARF